MRVAILHYHLNHGGVTRVIEGSSQALTTAGIQHVILHGGEVLEALPMEQVVRIPGLAYLDSSDEHLAELLWQDLWCAATEALGGPPDVWHFHNHSLGKNSLLPAVIRKLAEANQRLILQIHDLAEDGRPENFAKIAKCQMLYPVAPQITYAFLNSRDRENFITAGLPAAQALFLPNPVDASEISSRATRTILFAPIRGIRRKNLGELVLLAAIAPKECLVAVSRGPLNSTAQPIYRSWQNFAEKLGIPIQFAVTDRLAPAEGASADFTSWIAHASHFVSTSVAEGFGLPFLEAIAHGKPLIGRSISHLNTEQGTTSEWLYDRILVPGDWISTPILYQQLRVILKQNCRAYGQIFSDELVETIQHLHFTGAHLDFANLPEAQQQQVIAKIINQNFQNSLLVEIAGNREPAVDWLARAVANRTSPLSPALLEPYSQPRYQERLTALYQRLLSQVPGPVCDLPVSDILEAYLRPEIFHFLCSSLPRTPFCAVIFDIYGTLLIAPKTGVKVDPAADPLLRFILESHGFVPPASPSAALHEAVLRHHAASTVEFPEVDLRQLWLEILQLDSHVDLTSLVDELESTWHPSQLMPGAEVLIQHLTGSRIALGLLSNAQSNTLLALGEIAPYFRPDLTVLSYQHGIAKPSTLLLEELVSRLADLGISPQETLFVGNDPRQDILPAKAVGFKTALFIGHPDSLRPGDCSPDYLIHDLLELVS